MNAFRKGILLAALQCVLILSLTGKLLYDRATRPRVWIKTERYDPNLPIRGRYLSLVLVPDSGTAYFDRTNRQPVVFFIPEHRADFDLLGIGPQAPDLWAEVTIPYKGPPRPIRLGIKRAGEIQPIAIP
jgi:hypothetical protein